MSRTLNPRLGTFKRSNGGSPFIRGLAVLKRGKMGMHTHARTHTHTHTHIVRERESERARTRSRIPRHSKFHIFLAVLLSRSCFHSFLAFFISVSDLSCFLAFFQHLFIHRVFWKTKETVLWYKTVLMYVSKCILNNKKHCYHTFPFLLKCMRP
jgi:hypothetical protein